MEATSGTSGTAPRYLNLLARRVESEQEIPTTNPHRPDLRHAADEDRPG